MTYYYLVFYMAYKDHVLFSQGNVQISTIVDLLQATDDNRLNLVQLAIEEGMEDNEHIKVMITNLIALKPPSTNSTAGTT